MPQRTRRPQRVVFARSLSGPHRSGTTLEGRPIAGVGARRPGSSCRVADTTLAGPPDRRVWARRPGSSGRVADTTLVGPPDRRVGARQGRHPGSSGRVADTTLAGPPDRRVGARHPGSSGRVADTTLAGPPDRRVWVRHPGSSGRVAATTRAARSPGLGPPPRIGRANGRYDATRAPERKVEALHAVSLRRPPRSRSRTAANGPPEASIEMSRTGGRRLASSSQPSPSRHDPWRFLRCVLICVIAIADSWILEYFAAEWPGFRDLRSAASVPGQRDRLRNAVSIFVNDVRVAMVGAFLTAARRPSPGAAGPLSAADAARIDADVERARHLHSCARMLLTDGLRPLAWRLSKHGNRSWARLMRSRPPLLRASW